MTAISLPAPSLARRLALMLYESLLFGAVLVISTGIVTPLLPATLKGGQPAAAGSYHLLTLYLLAVGWLYFAWQWRRGQTLAMKTWWIRLVAADGGPVTWRGATLRYLGALLSWLALGAGFLWSAVDRDGLSWPDRISGTRLVLIARG